MRIAVLRLENWINVRVDRLIYTLRMHFGEQEDNILCISPREEYLTAFHDLRGTVKHVDLGGIRLSSIRLRIEPYYSWMKRKIRKILKRNKVDVIIAINIYSAMIAHELGYPLVFDDNEFYSLKEYVIGKRKSDIFHQFTYGRKLDIYKYYEEMLAQEHPIIAVSNAIAEYYIGLGASYVYTIPNLPSKPEYEIIEKALQTSDTGSTKNDATYLCYIGGYNDLVGTVKHRNLSIFLKIFKEVTKLNNTNINRMKLKIIGASSSPISLPNIETTGRIPHSEVLIELTKCDFGVLVWPPNPYNKYIAPHKGYLYIAAGLAPIVTRDMESYIESITGFDYYPIDTLTFRNSIKSTLYKIREIKLERGERAKRIKKAREKMIWDKYASEIIDSLKKI